MKPLFPGSSETGAMNLRALLDPASARPGQPKHTLHMALELHATGPAVESARPDLFVSFVLDTSGSMAGKPLEQVARSVHLLLELLGEQDHVGLVSFADQAVPAVGLAPLTAAHKRAMNQRLSALMGAGGTNLEGAIRTGHKLFGPRKPGTRHVMIVLTDGAANRGLSTPRDLGELAESLRSDVSITTLGFGAAHNPDVLSAIATRGGGEYWFIADPALATSEFARALGAQADIAADDVQLTIKLEEGVQLVEVLHATPRFSREGIVVPLPSLRSEARHWVIAKLLLDVPREPGRHRLLQLRVDYRTARGERASTEEDLFLPLREGELERHAEAATQVTLARVERGRAEARALADGRNFDAACALLALFMSELRALPGYVAMDGSAISEAVEQLVDEATEYATKPSNERLTTFKAENLGVNLTRGGGAHAADQAAGGTLAKSAQAAISGVIDAVVEVRKQSDPSWTRSVPWTGSELMFGRSASGGAVVLPAQNISKRHFRLYAMENGKVVVTDLKSTNTTQTRSITTGVVRRVDTPRIVSVDDEVIAGDFVITIKPAPKP